MCFSGARLCCAPFFAGRRMNMDLPYVMDTLFDLLNESDNLNAVELEEKEAEGKFLVTAHDGTKIMIQCSIVD
jgi:hypothetical protein